MKSKVILAVMALVILSAILLSCGSMPPVGEEYYLKKEDGSKKDFISAMNLPGIEKILGEKKLKDYTIDYWILRLASEQNARDTLMVPAYKMLITLNPVNDSSRRDSLIQTVKMVKDVATKPNTAFDYEWYDSVYQRMEYCYDRNYFYPVGGEVDIRTKLIFLLGLPDVDLSGDEWPCWTMNVGSGKKCLIFQLFWIQSGFEITLQDENMDGHPEPEAIPDRDQIREGNPDTKLQLQLTENAKLSNETLARREPALRLYNVKKVIKAALDVVSFPENDSSYTIGISSAVPLDQFDSDSTGMLNFSTGMVLYKWKGGRPVPIAIDSGYTVHIEEALGLSWYPLYTMSYPLYPGDYDLSLNLKGNYGEEGVVRLPFIIPSPDTRSGASDIVFCLTPPTVIARPDSNNPGINITNMIIRQPQNDSSTIAMMANPFLPPIFSPGDSIRPYVEFPISNKFTIRDGKFKCLVTIRLIKREAEADVRSGKIYSYQPVGSDSIRVIDKGQDKDINALMGDYRNQIYSTLLTTDSAESKVVFREPFKLPSNIQPGEYNLSIRVQDAYGKGEDGYNAFAVKLIRIENSSVSSK